MRKSTAILVVLLALGAAAAAGQKHVCPIRDYEKWMFDRSYQLHGFYRAWVFNRAMVWLEEKDGVEGSIIAYSARSPLLLTGKKQVSRFYTVEPNKVIEFDDEWTRFEKHDPKLPSEYMCLPTFQFQMDQHPILELEVRNATGSWQLAFTTKGRNGWPLYRSEIRTGPGKLAVPIRDILRKKGYRRHYGEVHFFFIVHGAKPQDKVSAECRLRLPGAPAVVPCYPVFRTIQTARAKGVPIYAVVADAAAQRLGKGKVSVAAEVAGRTVALADSGNGVWKAIVRDLPVGIHEAAIKATGRDGKPLASSHLDIVVNDGQYVRFDRTTGLLARGDRVLGPLSGSFIGTIPVKFQDDEDTQEVFLQTQAQFDGPGRPMFHWYESLTEPEYEQKFAFLERCGWTTAYFFSGWSSWERLDMAGKLAPHGTELWAMILRCARRHNINVLFSLTHYSYYQRDMSGIACEPWAQLTEAGFTEWKEGKQNQAWRDPNTALSRCVNAYFKRFTKIFNESTQLYGYTPNAEFERAIGVPRYNQMADTLRAGSPRHLLVVENYSIPGHVVHYTTAGWKSDTGGIDAYYMGQHAPADQEAGLYYKALRAAGMYVGEGCWPRYCIPDKRGWYGTRRYRVRVRDLVYIGLVGRCPIIHTWDEVTSEDERIVFEQVRRAVDWSQPFRPPPITLRAGPNTLTPKAGNPAYASAVKYAAALARLPLDYAVRWRKNPAPKGTLKEIDADSYVEPKFVSGGGTIPDAVKVQMPLRISPGYSANYTWSADGRTLIAYVRNTQSYGKGPGEWNRADFHRRHDKPADLTIALQNLPDESLRCRIYDLEMKKAIKEVAVRRAASFALGRTASDYVVLVTPNAN